MTDTDEVGLVLLETGERVQLDALTEANADPESRRVSGYVVEYGPVARANRGGRLKFSAGRITLPSDLSRVKLSRYHRGHPKQSFVGHAVAAEDRDDGLWMEFQLGTGPDADEALTEIRDKVNDGLSLELGNVRRRGYDVQGGYLEAVALVGVPAFQNARAIAAESDLAEADPDEDTSDGGDQLGDAEADADENTDANTDAEAERGEDTSDEDTDDEGEGGDRVDASTARPTGPAGTPATFRTGTRGRTRPRGETVDLESVIDAVYRLNTEGQTPDVMAALADIHPGNNPYIEAPEWLGKVWDGVPYVRRFVPLLDTSKPLTSRKHTGWRFTSKPEVDDYAGNKEEIPTGPVTTEEVTYTASRLAGGHDIDRAFYDFNEREVIAEYWAAMAESYARKSDLKALGKIVETADVANPVDSAEDILTAAALAAEYVGDAVTGDEGNTMSADYVLVNPADRRELLKLGQFDVPAFLALWNIDPSRFLAHASVPAGHVIAGASRAIVFREPRGVPIRVNAVNVPHGGHDHALFGYYATFDPFPEAVVTVEIGAGA